MRFKIPAKEAQIKTAEMLEAVDKVIELDKKRGELLRRLKLGIEQRRIGCSKII